VFTGVFHFQAGHWLTLAFEISGGVPANRCQQAPQDNECHENQNFERVDPITLPRRALTRRGPSSPRRASASRRVLRREETVQPVRFLPSKPGSKQTTEKQKSKT